MSQIKLLGMSFWLSLFLFACKQTPSPAESMAGFCKNYPRAEYASLERVDYTDDWFELYQVAPGITAIYEPHQWEEVISYLIEGEEEALLFDTGNGIADISAVVKSLTNKPVIVLNSHAHFDHVGANHAFTKIYGLDTDFSRQRQAGQPNENIAIEVSKQALCRPLPDGVTEQNHIGRAFSVSHIIEDGYVFDLGNRQLEVIHIPGHTPDSIALIDREAGLMWTGDSYYSGPIWLFAPETDLDAYQVSITRLVKEVPDLKALLPAHNTPWVKPEILLKVQENFLKMRNGDIQAVPQGDGMLEYKIAGEKFSFLVREMNTY